MQNLWKGQKVNEKVFGKVLISSICGIFLCLVCLVSTTWAWYVVGIENPNNTIEIASVEPKVIVNSQELAANDDGTYTLPIGEQTLQVAVDNKTATVYVVMSVGEKAVCYFEVASGQNVSAPLQVMVYDANHQISLKTQWKLPTVLPAGEVLTIGDAPAGTEDQEDDSQMAGDEENAEDSEDTGATDGENQTGDIPETGSNTETGDVPKTGTGTETGDAPETGSDTENGDAPETDDNTQSDT